LNPPVPLRLGMLPPGLDPGVLLSGNPGLGAALGGDPVLEHRAAGPCACGGACPKCSLNDDDFPRKPPPGEGDFEDDEFEPADAGFRIGPYDKSATIACNGSGGYRPKLEGSWVEKDPWAKCGLAECVRTHEESHASDWAKRFPDGCKNADGSFKPDGSAVPTGGPGYDEFLKKSECDAHTVDVACEEKLLERSSEECKPTVKTALDDDIRKKKEYCGGGC
jgi:hypothetical protein